MSTYRVIGLMSGTSLDGLDIAYCTFTKSDRWEYCIEKCVTIPYPDELKDQLHHCISFSKVETQKLDILLGAFIGKHVSRFMAENNIVCDFIASHGHTVLHQPDKGITLQIGNATKIAEAGKCTVISDFRTENVQLGGQGAPLVPIGDQLLFPEYAFCLNLGGISNISFDDEEGNRRAFDISPCNLVLNHYAQQLGMEYDDDGKLGRQGTVYPALLEALHNVAYYALSPPKSLGKEDIVNVFIPLIDQFTLSVQDKLATFYEHIAIHIAAIITGKTLATGGGAYNTFLMALIRQKTSGDIVVGDKTLTSFKEALLFGFLGVLRIRNEANVLKSYTGASRDACSGVITSY